MSDVTPGQAAYEARQAAKARRMGAPDSEPDSALVAIIGLRWEELPAGMRADEEAGAQAAIAARQPQPAPGCPDPSQHRDVYGRPLPDTMPQPVPGETELRRRIEDVARGLDHRVSAGSRTRMAVASSSLARILRDILAETAAGPEPQAAPELAGSVVRVISTAPELREAMAETRHLRADLRTLADLWDASSNRDEEIAARPNRARLVLEERATTRRNCAADIRKLAGPEGK